MHSQEGHFSTVGCSEIGLELLEDVVSGQMGLQMLLQDNVDFLLQNFDRKGSLEIGLEFEKMAGSRLNFFSNGFMACLKTART